MYSQTNKPRLLAFGMLLLAACSTDPAKKKIAYLDSGDKYITASKYNEAVIEYRNAIQIDPSFAKAHYKLALAYLNLNNRDNAYRELQQAVALNPSNSDAQLSLAQFL